MVEILKFVCCIWFRYFIFCEVVDIFVVVSLREWCEVCFRMILYDLFNVSIVFVIIGWFVCDVVMIGDDVGVFCGVGVFFILSLLIVVDIFYECINWKKNNLLNFVNLYY